MAHGQETEKEKTIVQHVTFSVTEDDPGPPPPNLVSKFSTVQDWLGIICDAEKPKKPITNYDFGLFISDKAYTLVLTGTNTYKHDENNEEIRIDFQPKEMYYVLPKEYSTNLNREQVYQKLIADIKSFTETQKFKSSFFCEANQLVFNSNGMIIWAKK